jgi:hypothetical protein
MNTATKWKHHATLALWPVKQYILDSLIDWSVQGPEINK